MTLRELFKGLNPQQKMRFARKAGTTVSYIEKNLLCESPDHKRVPRPDTMTRIYHACDGEVTYLELLCNFYPELATEQAQAQRFNSYFEKFTKTASA